jgi:outer membrane lipoprotein-sorting protein
LSQVLAKPAGVVSVKYDMIVTIPGSPTMTAKAWLKKTKMRTEITAGGITMVQLVDMDAKTAYMYDPAQNVAMKIDLSQTLEAPTTSVAGIERYEPVVTGTETVDRKVCLVVEYTAEGVKTKSWIWKENGFPIRMEAPDTEGTWVVEYKNIEFVDIPDSMFELPAGVQIAATPGV